MKVAIVGPIAMENVAHLLGASAAGAPRGYTGAPILATLIESMLDRGHVVVGITTDVGPDGVKAPVAVRGERLEMIYCPQRPRAFLPHGGSVGRAADLFARERRSPSPTWSMPIGLNGARMTSTVYTDHPLQRHGPNRLACNAKRLYCHDER